jgi:hypothetical protein
MRERPKAFLAEIFQEPSPHPGAADYIQELHEYLWRFVRAEFPWANGDLRKYIDVAIESAESRRAPDER